MSNLNTYQTIGKNSSAEFRDRGSRFIAYVYPIDTVEDFKKNIQQLKKDHPKASHHCFAYKLGTDDNNWRVSDDGEPSGTAGRPILGQIQSKEITNVMVVVVRYFGGSLLGVPGLINAYKTATSMALQLTPVVQKKVYVKFTVQFDYTRMDEVMRVLKKYDCGILSRDMQLFCNIQALIPKNVLEEALEELNNLQGLEINSA